MVEIPLTQVGESFLKSSLIKTKKRRKVPI